MMIESDRILFSILRDAEIEEALKLQPMRHDSHCINPE